MLSKVRITSKKVTVEKLYCGSVINQYWCFLNSLRMNASVFDGYTIITDSPVAHLLFLPCNVQNVPFNISIVRLSLLKCYKKVGLREDKNLPSNDKCWNVG